MIKVQQQYHKAHFRKLRFVVRKVIKHPNENISQVPLELMLKIFAHFAFHCNIYKPTSKL